MRMLKRAAKAAFVTTPLAIAGWHMNRYLFLWCLRLWHRATYPACPSCDQGVLERAPDAGVWRCGVCAFEAHGTLDLLGVREFARHHRQTRAQALLSTAEREHLKGIVGHHVRASRALFVVATALAAGGAGLAASGSTWLVVGQWLAFAVMFSVFALKRSYRAWQVTHGRLFDEGAAWHWLRHEKWLR